MTRFLLFILLSWAVAPPAVAAPRLTLRVPALAENQAPPDAGDKEAWQRDLRRARSRKTLGAVGTAVGVSILAVSAAAFCTAGVCDSESEKWTGLAVGAAGFGIAAFSVVSWVEAGSDIRMLEEDGRKQGYTRRSSSVGVQVAFRF
jgi:hypothetical protein